MSSIKNGNVMFRNLKVESKPNVHAGINKITLTAYMILNEWPKKTKQKNLKENYAIDWIVKK